MGQLDTSLISSCDFLHLDMAKAMKAMKAMAAMKAMRAMKKKPVSFRLARRHLFAGKLSKTTSGMTKGDFVQNKSGKIVSKKISLAARSHLGLQQSRRPARN